MLLSARQPNRSGRAGGRALVLRQLEIVPAVDVLEIGDGTVARAGFVVDNLVVFRLARISSTSSAVADPASNVLTRSIAPPTRMQPWLKVRTSSEKRFLFGVSCR